MRLFCLGRPDDEPSRTFVTRQKGHIIVYRHKSGAGVWDRRCGRKEKKRNEKKKNISTLFI